MAETMTTKNVPRILIVDDVETNRFVLRNIISDIPAYTDREWDAGP